MSSASYAQMIADKKWIGQQVNTLAHYIHGVSDEELILPPALKALMLALEARHKG